MRDVLTTTRCGYCKYELVSVVHLLRRANPACGTPPAWRSPYRDSERDVTKDGTSSKQAA
jgi:hypothetical protein